MGKLEMGIGFIVIFFIYFLSYLNVEFKVFGFFFFFIGIIR